MFPETKGKELPQTIEDMIKWEEKIRESRNQREGTPSDHRGYD